ncbi:MAG TPA: hypothetical protein VG273_01785 [Bryobacteraceae bacterium]|nr:hypothetical protein [Bryobacteraceae bacterium]
MTTLKRQIARRFTRLLRACVVITALAAMLAISTASTLPDHWHRGSAAARCDVCFAAHTAAGEAPSIHPVPVPLLQGRLPLLLPVSTYQPASQKSFRSRGPPSTFAL